MAAGVTLSINGEDHILADDPERSLLDILRSDLGLTATRFGCGQGHCGACNVLVDGRAVAACSVPAWSLQGRRVITLEGLGSQARPHPLQSAFIAEQAMQCGYCISGIIISAAALLATNPAPDNAAIRQALDGNLCRCGAHGRIIRAVQRAASDLRDGHAHG
jgi:nicotinate dehydrogenase subunit A